MIESGGRFCYPPPSPPEIRVNWSVVGPSVNWSYYGICSKEISAQFAYNWESQIFFKFLRRVFRGVWFEPSPPLISSFLKQPSVIKM